MIRAEVWCIDGMWQSGIDHHPERHARSRMPIWCRPYAVDVTVHPTHAAALAHALAAAGLAPEEERDE